MSTIRYECLISADSHIREPNDLWWNAMGKTFGDRTPRVVDQRDGRPGKYFYNGIGNTKIGDIEGEFAEHFPELQGAAADPEIRIRFQEQANISAELLNPTQMSNIMPGSDGEMIRAAAAVLNDYLAEFISHDPKRLLANAMIPMHDVGWAIAEAVRVKKRGLNGIIINTVSPHGCPPYRDKIYDPFWATVEDLGMPITLHIITGRVLDPILYAETEEERGAAPAQVLALFNEIETPLANDFIFGGIFDRFEGIDIVGGEFELSWIPNFMWRMDQMQEGLGALFNLPKTKLRASEYVKTRTYHGFIDDPHCLEVIEKIGADCVVWGTDFPHIRSIGPEAQDKAWELFNGLPRADQEKIVGGTTARLYAV